MRKEPQIGIEPMTASLGEAARNTEVVPQVHLTLHRSVPQDLKKTPNRYRNPSRFRPGALRSLNLSFGGVAA